MSGLTKQDTFVRDDNQGSQQSSVNNDANRIESQNNDSDTSWYPSPVMTQSSIGSSQGEL